MAYDVLTSAWGEAQIRQHAVEKECDQLRAFAQEAVDALRLMVSPVKHLPGCLWRDDKRMPCQCGYNDRINMALNQTRTVIAKAEPLLIGQPSSEETK